MGIAIMLKKQQASLDQKDKSHIIEWSIKKRKEKMIKVTEITKSKITKEWESLLFSGINIKLYFLK